MSYFPPDAIGERQALFEYLGQRNLAIKGQWERKEITADAARLWLAEAGALQKFVRSRRQAHEAALCEAGPIIPLGFHAAGDAEPLLPHERGTTGEPERR